MALNHFKCHFMLAYIEIHVRVAIKFTNNYNVLILFSLYGNKLELSSYYNIVSNIILPTL